MLSHERCLANRNVLVAAACLFALLGLPERGHSQEKIADRVGRIIIEGNDQTPDWAILRFVKMRPGKVLDYKELDAARKGLCSSGLFDKDEPPTVELLPSELDGVFKDIRIRVKEQRWNWVKFQVYDLAIAARFQNAILFLQAAYLVKENVVNRR